MIHFHLDNNGRRCLFLTLGEISLGSPDCGRKSRVHSTSIWSSSSGTWDGQPEMVPTDSSLPRYQPSSLVNKKPIFDGSLVRPSTSHSIGKHACFMLRLDAEAAIKRTNSLIYSTYRYCTVDFEQQAQSSEQIPQLGIALSSTRPRGGRIASLHSLSPFPISIPPSTISSSPLP